MDFLIFKAPMLMVQASLDGILLGILFALIAYGMALQWGVNEYNQYCARRFSNTWRLYCLHYVSCWNSSAWGVIVSPIIMFFVGWALYKLVINKSSRPRSIYLNFSNFWYRNRISTVNEFYFWSGRCGCSIRVRNYNVI